MKKLLLFSAVILLYACSKKSNPTTPTTPNPNPSTPQAAKFIPNWRTDTLAGKCVDVNGQFIVDSKGKYVEDTLFTYTTNDTSFIKHDGQVYYIWWNAAFATDTFVNNDKAYINCTISTTKDTTGKVNTYNVMATPYRS